MNIKVDKTIKLLSVPLGTTLALLMSLVLSFNFGWKTLKNIESESTKETEILGILSEKQIVLQQLEGDIEHYTGAVSAALPGKNVVMSAVSQVKLLAEENDLLIYEFGTITSPEKEGVSASTISISVVGRLESILGLLIDLTGVLPLAVIETADITHGSSDSSHAEISFIVYEAGYPGTLPTIYEPIDKLTDGEVEQLLKLNGYRSSVITEVTPSTPGERLNPFAF